MTKTVVGLFDDFDVAQRVVQDLTNNGFSRDSISLLANNVTGEYNQVVEEEGRERADQDRVSRGEEAGISAGAGAAAGGIGGLLIGLGLFAVPGIGPALAAGPIAATLAGAGIGAAAGGLSGALFHAGVPEHEAHYYTEGIRRGGTLIMVNTDDSSAERARDVIARHNPVDIQQRAAMWKEQGWDEQNPQTEPYTAEEIERERTVIRAGQPAQTQREVGSNTGTSPEAEFRNHFTHNFAHCNYPYEGGYNHAYHYGFDLARDERYHDTDWASIEPQVRQRWEERNPSTWDQFRDAIHFAWDKGRGKA